MRRNRLPLANRLALPVQSHVHSRGGRAAGKRMAELNLPIMSMNATVQAVVPPPKYAVTDLVDCEMGSRARLEHLFLIERGAETLVDEVKGDEAVEALLHNTEDAYGFPPYPSLARHITVGGLSHLELKSRERTILQYALGGRSLTRIVAADYGWADIIVGRLGLRQRDAQVVEPEPVPAL
jgi:hypothetical protein